MTTVPFKGPMAVALLAALLVPIHPVRAHAADATDAASIEEQKREFKALRGKPADWGPRYRTWDPSTVQTFKGTVMNVDRVPGHRGNIFLQLNVKAETETIGVFLGPQRWVERQPMKIKVADEVTVTGSRIKFRQHPLVLAAEVKKGDATLVLRDANGAVKWPAPEAPLPPVEGMSTEEPPEH